MQIVPYLIFNGNCREAFSCYHQHLGGTLEAMLPFGDSPECGDIPADWKDKIMHARLVVGSFALMASDNHPAYPYEGIKGCSISLNVDSKAEAERLFNALAEGARSRCRWARPSGRRASACSPTASAWPGWSTASRTGSVRYAGPPPGESAAGPCSTVRESRSIDALLR